jgi:hypothetical protein
LRDRAKGWGQGLALGERHRSFHPRHLGREARDANKVAYLLSSLIMTIKSRIIIHRDRPHLTDGREVGLVLGIRDETPGISRLRHILAEVWKTSKKELCEQEKINREMKRCRI